MLIHKRVFSHGGRIQKSVLILDALVLSCRIKMAARASVARQAGVTRVTGHGEI